MGPKSIPQNSRQISRKISSKTKGQEKKAPPDIAPKSFLSPKKGQNGALALRSIGVMGKSALEIGQFLRGNFWMISGGPFPLPAPLFTADKKFPPPKKKKITVTPTSFCKSSGRTLGIRPASIRHRRPAYFSSFIGAEDLSSCEESQCLMLTGYRGSASVLSSLSVN